MQIIIATDIHGVTDGVRALFENFDQHPLRFLSPWDRDENPYPTEQEAVKAFHAEQGLLRYQQKIAKVAGGAPALLIGFSVGASALWHYASSDECHGDSRAVMYYGSRIRDHLTLVPRCKSSLIFAEHESAFAPHLIVDQLRSMDRDCTLIAGTAHGFMNPHSPHFDSQETRRQLDYLRAISQSLSPSLSHSL